jgi:hypothetical protein
VPSVSRKQHNLMEAVAHSPSFAKKVGIPQTVGKHYHEADKMKRKFADGGIPMNTQAPAMPMQSQTAPGSPTSPSNFSDATFWGTPAGNAYLAKNNAGGFWGTPQGIDLTNQNQTVNIGGQSFPTAPPKGTPQYDAFMSQVVPAMQQASQNAMQQHLQNQFNTAGNRFQGMHSRMHPGMGLRMGPKMGGIGGPMQPQFGAPQPTMPVGIKKGGHISAYKKGGHVKPNELKGKAKETKSIAREEMKALKRGHAPKAVMEHERAEHKAMGYKKGGTMKHHSKHMARGGMGRAMPPRRRSGPSPAALAAMLGPTGAGQGSMGAGPGAPPGMGGPGMAHGGGVHHHHHYYVGGGVTDHMPKKTKKYAAGGAISTPTKKPETEAILKRRPSTHGRDGAAIRGKTRGMEPKMKRGGHVKMARGGGIEMRGKTRGKMC